MKNNLKDEHKRLNGTWYQTYVSENGVECINDEKGVGSISEFNNGLFSVWSVEGAQVLEGKYTINPAMTPAEIDWTDSVGIDKGRTFPSIYSLTNDTFEFCAADEGMERPVDFEPRIGYTIRRFSKMSNGVRGV